MNIGQNVYIARIKKGVTQEKLAAETGIPQANICNFEGGKRDITMATFLRICYALGVKPYEMFLEARARKAPFVWSRARVERMADYAVRGKGRLSPDEKRVADLVISVLPARGKRVSARQSRLNWLALRQLVDTKEINFLCQRIRDARQRNA